MEDVVGRDVRGICDGEVVGLAIAIVAREEIGHEGVGEGAIAFAGEVGVVGLGPTGVDPAPHGAEATHALLLVPKGAVVGAADGALGVEDGRGAREGGIASRVAADTRRCGAVSRAEDQDGGVRQLGVDLVDDAGEGGRVGLGVGAGGGFVGAVGEDDEVGVGLVEVGGEQGLVPAEDERGDGAV